MFEYGVSFILHITWKTTIATTNKASVIQPTIIPIKAPSFNSFNLFENVLDSVNVSDPVNISDSVNGCWPRKASFDY